ncbi:MAG: phosphoribosylanthranilate isomerase [Cellulophaga sp.]
MNTPTQNIGTTSSNQTSVAIKVCGMKIPSNMSEVANLQPDYMGFIFWEPSKRFFKGEIPKISNTIKKVGVFVNARLEEITAKVVHYNLQAIQLHGKETPQFCIFLNDALKNTASKVEIIKVFSIKDDFDFSELTPFENVCDYYLFDTKGKLPGGNGYTFNWEALSAYPSTKPYFLSGGIGLDELDKVASFFQKPASKYCHAIDVNSKFEIEPGLKHIDKLKKLLKEYGK